MTSSTTRTADVPDTGSFSLTALARSAIRTIEHIYAESRAGRAAREAARLNALSDSDLAELGLTRDEIAARVLAHHGLGL